MQVLYKIDSVGAVPTVTYSNLGGKKVNKYSEIISSGSKAISLTLYLNHLQILIFSKSIVLNKEQWWKTNQKVVCFFFQINGEKSLVLNMN